ncbi:MAG: ribonuclease HI family protein [Elusimicrobiaceae bacterium]|nr:ribonuclease HI family protein [Elusimicrobiaceae bacterium]
MKLLINIDGGCRGNPGPGSSAVVIKDETGRLLKEEGRYLGPLTTNNKAEFTALHVALECARELRADELDIRSDSLLLVKQYSGEFRIKNPDLAALMTQIRALAKHFARVRLSHVRRELNREADALANRVLDSAERGESGPAVQPDTAAGRPGAPAADRQGRANPPAGNWSPKPAARGKKHAEKPADAGGPEQLTLF